MGVLSMLFRMYGSDIELCNDLMLNITVYIIYK